MAGTDLERAGAFGPLDVLEQTGHLTATSLTLPDDTTPERWEAVGYLLGHISDSSAWWIGDWSNEGERLYEHGRYEQGIEATGLAYGTLATYSSVCRSYESSIRIEDLSFAHHQVAQGLPPRRRAAMLKKAKDDGWKVGRLREEMRSQQREERIKELAKEAEGLAVDDRVSVISGRFQDAAIATSSIDVIVTDPPYDLDAVNDYVALSQFAARVLKPGGSLFAMVGQTHLPDTLAALATSLDYHWLIAYLTPGGQSPLAPMMHRRVNSFWKPVVWFTNGDYGKGLAVGDVRKSTPNDNDKRFHNWGQAESGMLDLIDNLTPLGCVVLDPYCGGGTTGVAAVISGRRFVGVEQNDKLAKAALARIVEALP